MDNVGILVSWGDLNFLFGGDFDPPFIDVEDFHCISKFSFFKPSVFSWVTFPSNKVRLVIRWITMF